MKSERALPVLIFALLFLVNLSVSHGAPDVTDGKRAFLYAENLALNGRLGLALDLPSAETEVFPGHSIRSMNSSLQIVAERSYRLLDPDGIAKDEYIGRFMEQNRDEFYYQVPLVLPVLAAPLYKIAEAVGATPIELVPLYLNSIIIAVFGVIMFAIGRELFNSEKIGLVMALMFGLTTFMWPYVSSMFARPLALMFLFLGLYLVLYGRKRGGVLLPVLAGASVGMSYIAHPNLLTLAPAVLAFGLIQYRKNRKQIMALILVSIVMVGFMACLNHYRFGAADSFGWNEKPIQAQIARTVDERFYYDGLVDLLASPSDSVLLYVPIIVLHPLGLYYIYKKNRGLALLLAYLTGVTYVATADVLATNTLGNGWGPHRYLLPVIPGIVVSAGAVVSRFSRSLRAAVPIVALACVGFYVNLHGALVFFLWVGHYLTGPLHLTDVVASIRKPEYSTIPITQRVIEEGYVYSHTGCYVTPYYYCEYGVAAVLVLAALISLTGWLILRSLGVRISLPAGRSGDQHP